jgi:hypothetical protein
LENRDPKAAKQAMEAHLLEVEHVVFGTEKATGESIEHRNDPLGFAKKKQGPPNTCEKELK